MVWYLPPGDFYPNSIPLQEKEIEIDPIPVAKEGSKYLIPSIALGAIFKDFSARISTFPVEYVITNSGYALNFAYVSMIGVFVLGIYKMAKNIENQKYPPPSTITVLKSDYDKLIQENTNLKNKVKNLDHENFELRSHISNTGI